MNAKNAQTTVLVTGASGYIATHCILQLLQQGYQVRGTLRSPAREEGLRQTFARHVDADDRLEFVTADLLKDAGWAEAANGCRYVLHIASPNELDEPKEEDAWIAPARDGTLRLLQAAAGAGVERVVLTSSLGAIASGHDPQGRVFTEEDWSDLNKKIGAYLRSKTVAERAAWDFMANLPDNVSMDLVSINPSYVFGPLLEEDMTTSLEIVARLMRRDVPGLARLGFPIVDVRDTAAAHLMAMTAPQAGGQRFLCNTEFLWMEEIAQILDHEFAARGYRIPTRVLPDALLRFLALFDPALKRVTPSLGKRTDASSERLRSTLGWQPRPVEASIIDTAESLIAFNLV